MGSGTSKEEKFKIRRSRDIDRELVKEKKQISLKLLLLGTAECGKTTVLKQMKILHGIGFNETEIFNQRSAVYYNLITSMKLILAAMSDFSIPFENFEREVDAIFVSDIFLANDVKQAVFPLKLANAIKRLWSDPGVQQCFTRGYEYHLIDSAKYFFDSIDRISQPSYMPDEQDILRSRVPTNGIVEIQFFFQKTLIKLFDVGGQRSQRRKWIYCFDNVNAVLFITSLSEYNVVLLEDDYTNRTQESMKLFNTICETSYFQQTAFILFFNKTDIFAEKIPHYPLKIAFPDYQGSQTYGEAINYFQESFIKKQVTNNKTIYTHQTCATDTKTMKFVLNTCLDIVMELNLKESGLL